MSSASPGAAAPPAAVPPTAPSAGSEHGAAEGSAGGPGAAIGAAPAAAPPVAAPTREAPPPPAPPAPPAEALPSGAAPARAAPASPAPALSAPARPAPPRAPAAPAKPDALAALDSGSIGLPGVETAAPGFMPAGGGQRRVVPERVQMFPLPHSAAAGATEPLASSLVFLQSLRQTRMAHMMQVLTPWSQRQRSGTELLNILPEPVLGLVRGAPTALLPLGRADVTVGPMTYYGVRFYEVVPGAAPAPARPKHDKPRWKPSPAVAPRPLPPHLLARAPSAAAPGATPGLTPPRPAPSVAAPNAVATSSAGSGVAAPSSAGPGVTPAPSGRAVGPAPVGTAHGVPPATSGGGTTAAAAATAPPGAASSPAAAPPPPPSATSPASAPAPTAPATTTAPAPAASASPAKPAPSHATAPSAQAPAPPSSHAPTPTHLAAQATPPAKQSAAPPSSTSGPVPAVPPSQGTSAPSAGPLTTPTPGGAPAAAPRSAPAPGGVAPINPPLDPAFIRRVQLRADRDPQLQQLLHLARERRLPESGIVQLNAILTALMRETALPPPPPLASTAPRPPPPSPPPAPAPAPRDALAPPVVVVEFPENPSVHFLLPLWHTAVERVPPRVHSATVVLSFLMPAIGSRAAGDSGMEDARRAVHGMLVQDPAEVAADAKAGTGDAGAATNGASAPASDAKAGDTEAPLARAEQHGLPSEPPPPPARAGAAAPPTEAGAAHGRAAAPAALADPAPAAAPAASTPRSRRRPPAKRETRRTRYAAADAVRDDHPAAETPEPAAPPPPPSRRHELFPVTWRLTHESALDGRLWECFGRVPGCVTQGTYATPRDERMMQATKASLRARLAHGAPRRDVRGAPALYTLPKHLAPEDEPAGLAEHLVDRYALRYVTLTTRPQPKRKVASLSTARDVRRAAAPAAVPRVLPALGDGAERPKRKRHVATHNPDGSIKSCGACGKTKTPMWRRGPKGPSQLCNACGAKWKAGRLVVPDVPPPPVMNEMITARHVKQRLESPPLGGGASAPRPSERAPASPAGEAPAAPSGGLPAAALAAPRPPTASLPSTSPSVPPAPP